MAETNPHGTYRRNHGRGHSYFIDGAKVQGVTTILNAGMPKTALYNWAGREAAREAVDNWAELGQLPVMQRYERIADAPNATRDRAGVKGTRIHKIAERLVAGESVDVPEEIRGHVEACVSFIDAYRVQPVLTEFPVFSRAHEHAGSPDLLATMDLPDELSWDLDLPVLVDWKTNAKGPYGEAAMQLAAYRWSEFYLREAGKQWVETPMPKMAGCLVVWLRSDGYDVYPMESGPEIYRAFLFVQQVAHVATECRNWKGEALVPPIRAKEPVA